MHYETRVLLWKWNASWVLEISRSLYNPWYKGVKPNYIASTNHSLNFNNSCSAIWTCQLPNFAHIYIYILYDYITIFYIYITQYYTILKYTIYIYNPESPLLHRPDAGAQAHTHRLLKEDKEAINAGEEAKQHAVPASCRPARSDRSTAQLGMALKPKYGNIY